MDPRLCVLLLPVKIPKNQISVCRQATVEQHGLQSIENKLILTILNHQERESFVAMEKVDCYT